MWTTKLTDCLSGEDQDAYRIVAHLRIEDAGGAAPVVTAWPEELYLELVLPKSRPLIHFNQ
jgi:hypothetical protein